MKIRATSIYDEVKYIDYRLVLRHWCILPRRQSSTKNETLLSLYVLIFHQFVLNGRCIGEQNPKIGLRQSRYTRKILLPGYLEEHRNHGIRQTWIIGRTCSPASRLQFIKQSSSNWLPRRLVTRWRHEKSICESTRIKQTKHIIKKQKQSI